MLSPRQTKIYHYLQQYITTHGQAPTLEQIGQAVGLKSVSTVHDHLKVLEEKQLIDRPDHKKRNISLTKNPSLPKPEGTTISITHILTGSSPLRPVQNQTINLSSKQIQLNQPVFAIKVQDTHLKSEGILPEDILIFKHTLKPHNDDILLIELANGVNILRRYLFQDSIHHLYPITGDKSPMRIAAFKLKGKLLHLHREY